MRGTQVWYSWLLVVAVLAGCGKRVDPTAGPSNPLIGQWTFDKAIVVQSDSGKITTKYTLAFTADSVTLINHCAFSDGTTLSASVTAAAQIDTNSFNVTQSQQQDATDAQGRTCSAIINGDNYSYTVSGNALNLKDLTTSESSTLKRLSQ